jgi:CelD/BcsL family acetyltransferase involved in cellulose biosynthesis
MLALADELEVNGAFQIEDLESFRQAWEGLWQGCEEATPFQSPAWLIPWWRHLGQGKLHCLTFWRGGELCGLAPFYIYTRPHDGVRQLLLLGSGNSDYLDILIRPGHEPRVLRLLAAWLDSSREHWDVAEFFQLRSSSPLLRFQLSGLAPSLLSEVTTHESCPVLTLPAAPQDDWAFFQQPCFAKLDYYWRRANRTGCLKIEAVNMESLDEALDPLIAFEDARWAERGVSSVLSEPAIQRFHRGACYNLCAAGLLRFYVLRLDGRIISAFYGFHHRERAFYYLAGFDAEFSKLSPGKLILAHAVERAVRERMLAFDFLRGQETYKYEWGAQDTSTCRLAIRAETKEAGYEHSSNHYQT